MDADRLEQLRDEIAAAFDAANSSLIGDRSYARCIRALPALGEPDAVAEWLFAIAGGDGTGGLILDVKTRIGRGAPVDEMRAWIKAYDLLSDLRNALKEIPAKASCECVSGCSACDGRGVDFDGAEAA